MGGRTAVTPDQRLARIALGLRDAGIEALVMGGHAVRYYGVDRNTIDFDFHISVGNESKLDEVLVQHTLFRRAPLVEGPSWRPKAFRRFRIGFLDDGREEWMEFWLSGPLRA